MANRRRLGVAVIIDAPVADEINGLRRAVGDRALERIVPHVTLVPPVNVPAACLSDALARLRAAAATCPEPLHLTLGPPGSFLPANPVLTLAVAATSTASGVSGTQCSSSRWRVPCHGLGFLT